MKIFSISFVFLLLFATEGIMCLPLLAAEEALDNNLKLQVSQKTVSFKIFEEEIDAELSTLGLSWNHSFQQGFLGINLEQTLQQDTVRVTSGFGRLSREDYSLVLGYNIFPWLSLYGGYLYGDTEAEIRDFDANPVYGAEVHIIHRGPYAGLGLNYAFDSGILALNVAYARMEGLLSHRPLTQSSGDVSVTTKGTTSGFSYGLSWVGEIDSTMSYIFGVKVNRYNFEDNDLAYRSTNSSEPRDSSTRENFTIFSFAVSRYF